MIGYMLQQALKNNLPQREVSVLLTQVEVDAADPALTHRPSTSTRSTKNKPVRWQQKKAGCLRPMAVTSTTWCLPPQPKRIVERCHYRAYPARSPGDGGGGGVPVVENANGYHGVKR